VYGACDRDAARRGVLDDDAGGPLGELLDALQGDVGVEDVVVGELLAVQLVGPTMLGSWTLRGPALR